jgi:inhibitor of cysteine peptidase
MLTIPIKLSTSLTSFPLALKLQVILDKFLHRKGRWIVRPVVGTVLSLLLLFAFITTAPGEEGKGITVIEKANGTTVKLTQGRILTVMLAGNPTTGYSWSIDKNDKTRLSPVGKPEYIRDPAPEGIVGSGGMYRFKFKAEKTGTTDLKLVYKRPWEKDKKPAKTFTLKVVIE